MLRGALLFSSLALWMGTVVADPLRLAVLGMPLEELEEEVTTQPASPPPAPTGEKPITPPSGSPPAPPVTPPSSEVGGGKTTAGDRKEKDTPASENKDKREAEAPPEESQDMALFRILRDSRHEFFLSSLGLPVYGNQQRLDPDLCLAVAWDGAARWQSRLCYRAVYAELQQKNATTGELVGTFNLQRADGRLNLVNFVYDWGPGLMVGVGWTVSRYLLDFNRTGQALDLGGERFDQRSTAVWLSSGIQLGLYHQTRAGSVLRFRVGVEPLGRFDMDQEYFIGNEAAAGTSFQQGSGTVYTLAASLTRRLGRRLEGMVDLRYRRLPMHYETRLSAVTGTGEIQLVDRFRGTDELLRSGARLTLHLPRASVSPYLEGAMYYTSNKDELDREYIYYSGWRLFLGVSRFF